jgi:fermentation-respiration switch protein FrsA (DUF1100 family)
MKSKRFLVVSLAVLAILATASYLAAGIYVTYRYKTASRRHPYDVTPEMYGLSKENVQFTSEDGVPLVGWYIASSDPSSPNADAAVAVVHGHYGSMGRSWEVRRDDGAVVQSSEFEKGVLALHQAGFNVLLFDLRNHGESGGSTPVSLGLYESRDVLAAVRWLAQRPGVNPTRIGAKGSSMGGASVLLAGELDSQSQGLIKAMWVDSTYSTASAAICDVLRYRKIGLLKWSTLLWSETLTGLDLAAIRPIRAIASIHVPVQLVHSIDDAMLDYHQSIDLLQAAEPSCCNLWITAGYGHNLSWQHEDYQQRLVQFFDEHL